MENSMGAISIQDILGKDEYIIPMYQRSYAWGRPEIEQLIIDIDEFFKTDDNKKYYLGALTCFKRLDGKYELIDGQQRHTTLTLINALLRPGKALRPNLFFECRPESDKFIKNLYFDKSEDEASTETSTLQNAIQIIEDIFSEKSLNKNEKFKENFLKNVLLFRVEVPEDTDLNHYFEIMNNRGEQLEKHEIVKALLMGKIEDIKVQNTFATIWDACSDMSNYVWFNVNTEDRKTLFEHDGNIKVEIDDFSKISILESPSNQDKTLVEIIGNNTLSEKFPEEEKNIKDKYKSVIDFPNFLLQVFKIKNETISLDDKKLLSQFIDTKPDPKEFIFDLLKYRTLFDKYIIKHDLSNAEDDKQNWGIRTINDENAYVVNTFQDNGEELVKLQTMLYYSNPSNTYNNWVQEILKGFNNDIEIDLISQINKGWSIAKNRFNNNGQLSIEDIPLSYPIIPVYNLYFIDFLLWKLYKEKVQVSETKFDEQSLEGKISKNKEAFNSFKFRQLNSKEHLFPQSKANDFMIDGTVLNGIGNLCLISTSQNSSGNKDLPSAKKKSFIKDNSSLKRLIMFESFNGDTWSENEIKDHEKQITALIEYYFPKDKKP